MDISTSEDVHIIRSEALTKLPIITLDSSVTNGPALFLLDSGSTVNLISEQVLTNGLKFVPSKVNVKTLGEKPVTMTGSLTKLPLMKGDATITTQNFLVTSSQLKDFDGILGTPFLSSGKAMLDFDSHQLKTLQYALPFLRFVETPVVHACCPDESCSEKENQMNNLINEIRSSPLVPLILHGKTTFPAMSNGLIRVQGPKRFVNTMIVMEPTCVRSHFLIGGTALTLDNDAQGYLPAMNILDKQVEIKNHQYTGEAYVIKDPRLYIGAEEPFTDQEYNGLNLEQLWNLEQLRDGERESMNLGKESQEESQEFAQALEGSPLEERGQALVRSKNSCAREKGTQEDRQPERERKSCLACIWELARGKARVGHVN
jgi:hypothetical protein